MPIVEHCHAPVTTACAADGQPLTAPADSPARMCRWNTRKRVTIGTEAMTRPAIISVGGTVVLDVDRRCSATESVCLSGSWSTSRGHRKSFHIPITEKIEDL